MNAQTQSVARIENPLSNGQNKIVHHSQSNSALVSTESQRAIAEVQAALAIAKSFPRDRVAAVDRILNDCQRSGLAQVAVYQYARGGTSISGPTIRLAESLAQNWGNIQYGVRELSQANGESTVEAFAWDVETNTRQTKIFQVPHVRYTKSGGTAKLVDPRDIYEAVANNGARRLRACILGVIPGDIVEAALQQCDLTLNTYADTSPEGIQKIIKAFEKYGVSKEALEKRIQCRMEAIKPAQIVSLTKIGTSLKEGMSNPSDWFELSASAGAGNQENKEDPSDFAALKHRILTIKSIDDLNACEEQVLDHANSDERKQLMQLIKAQSQKFQPIAEAAPAKKPEPAQEEAPPVEEAKEAEQPKKTRTRTTPKVVEEITTEGQVVEVTITGKTSDEHLKEYSKSLNSAKSKAELNEIHENFIINEGLKTAHLEQLKKIYEECKSKFESSTAVDPIKSKSAKGGLQRSISESPTVEALLEVAKTIRSYESKLTKSDMQEVLNDYAARKTFLEEQQDMFADVVDAEVTYFESAILRIQNAKSQDDINDVYADPAFDEISGADRERIDKEAQQREAELQD